MDSRNCNFFLSFGKIGVEKLYCSDKRAFLAAHLFHHLQHPVNHPWSNVNFLISPKTRAHLKFFKLLVKEALDLLPVVLEDILLKLVDNLSFAVWVYVFIRSCGASRRAAYSWVSLLVAAFFHLNFGSTNRELRSFVWSFGCREKKLSLFASGVSVALHGKGKQS